MRKYYFLLFLAYILPNAVSAQDNNYTKVYNFQAPSVAAFNTYGSIPVSLYTGTPDISIPIYTIRENRLEIPIVLRYNINNVKPNSHPGVTGLGWTLFAGGSITRSQNGAFFDEYKDHISAKDFGYLNNEKRLADDWYNHVNSYNWNSIDTKTSWFSHERLQNEVQNLVHSSGSSPSFFRDISPDKFSFNFLNYSGSFYRDHTGKWVVDSEIPFIVKHEVITYSKTREQISKPIPKSEADQSTFKSFTLIAPDGLEFTFGGIDAIDYSISYYQQGYSRQYPVATTWHLSKITFPDSDAALASKESIEFEYQLSTPILEGNWSFAILSESSTLSNVMNGKGLNLQLILPVLLNKIKSSEFGNIADFSYKETKELAYPETFFPKLHTYQGGSVSINLANYVGENNVGDRYRYIESYKDIKWQQLDKIKLYYPEYEISLIYTESENERLKLKSLKKVAGNLAEIHSFEYNSTKLPPYFSGHYDHMGFYNGRDFSFTLNDTLYASPAKGTFNEIANRFYQVRHPDGSRNVIYAGAEMLNKITYPTGGHSAFEYEPHNAGYRVKPDRQSLQEIFNYPGGIRIKKISNYTDKNTFAYANTYYYFLDFNPKDKELGNFSGIAAFTPNYKWGLYDRSGIFVKQYLTSGGTSQAYANIEGSHIGYSTVTECREDINGNIEGYTTYNYTNFGAGYFDKSALASVNSHPISPFTPFSSNATKRGKLLSKKTYDRNNRLKEEITNKYDKYDNAKVRFIDLQKIDETSIPNPDFNGTQNIVLGGSYEVEIYDYKISSETSKRYEDSGEILVSKSYKYDNNKQLKTETVENSLGKDYILTYNYPYNYPQDNGYSDLVFRNMISTPIEKITSNNNVEIAREKTIYTFNTLGTIRRSLPSSIQTSYSGPIGLKDVFIYNRFNSFNKPLEVIGKDGIKVSYIWGYNEQFVVAELVNVDILVVWELMKQLNISIEDLEKGIMSKINLLREKLSDTQITTYTHKPLIGVSSMTDSRGMTTYYDYDTFGRLKETYIIENGVKKIIQVNNYHYQNQ